MHMAMGLFMYTNTNILATDNAILKRAMKIAKKEDLVNTGGIGFLERIGSPLGALYFVFVVLYVFTFIFRKTIGALIYNALAGCCNKMCASSKTRE